MIEEKNDLGIQGSITLAGALREKNEYNVSKIVYDAHLARFRPIRTLRRHENVAREVVVVVNLLFA